MVSFCVHPLDIASCQLHGPLQAKLAVLFCQYLRFGFTGIRIVRILITFPATRNMVLRDIRLHML